MNLLCRLRLHEWTTTRVEGHRYFMLKTQRCRRDGCPATRQEIRT